MGRRWVDRVEGGRMVSKVIFMSNPTTVKGDVALKKIKILYFLKHQKKITNIFQS